jgi:predicted CoA-binding protein
MNVVVIGASNKPERYSNKAMLLLKEYGHTPIPVAPSGAEILGYQVYSSLNEIKTPVHTVTMYIGKDRQAGYQEDIVKLNPERVIFNPGTENKELGEMLKKAGIEVIEHCTLIMLNNAEF